MPVGNTDAIKRQALEAVHAAPDDPVPYRIHAELCGASAELQDFAPAVHGLRNERLRARGLRFVTQPAG